MYWGYDIYIKSQGKTSGKKIIRQTQVGSAIYTNLAKSVT